jgi:small GTP-binding protein
MLTTSHPKFAVVGHPNKGKSSIVASLAMDDTVQISDTPGTTIKKRSFPLSVDGKVLYELFDTPGFQRARQVLAWLEKHDVSAAKRHEVVELFINAHKGDPKFNDEIELLEPIMEGAGIIYVVDGSKPYG